MRYPEKVNDNDFSKIKVEMGKIHKRCTSGN